MSQIKLIGIPPPLWLADPSVCSDWARPLQQQLQEWKLRERRIAKGVNLANERVRYTQACSQVETTAASLSDDLRGAAGDPLAWERCWRQERLPSITLSAEFLDVLAKRHWELQQSGQQDPRLAKSITSPEMVATRARVLLQGTSEIPAALQKWKECADLLMSAGWGLIEAPLPEETPREPRRILPAARSVPEIKYERREDLFVMEKFLRRGLSTFQANEERLRQEVRSALLTRGRVNVQNQGHEITTTVLGEFVMAETNEPAALVRVAYRDNSEARPFPLRCLPPPQLGLNRDILPIALMSMRHLELDAKVFAVWFRNLEGSGKGLTADSDERLYDLSVARLAELKAAYRDRPLKIHLFHTGLEPAVIGFYRAFVESLLGEPDREPWAIVEPRYARNGGVYESGMTWPATPVLPAANPDP